MAVRHGPFLLYRIVPGAWGRISYATGLLPPHATPTTSLLAPLFFSHSAAKQGGLITRFQERAEGDRVPVGGPVGHEHAALRHHHRGHPSGPRKGSTPTPSWGHWGSLLPRTDNGRSNSRERRAQVFAQVFATTISQICVHKSRRLFVRRDPNESGA